MSMPDGVVSYLARYVESSADIRVSKRIECAAGVILESRCRLLDSCNKQPTVTHETINVIYHTR